MPNRRSITLPVPRCPLCDAIMEEAQLLWDYEDQRWQETWGCDSCHTLHTFPARLAFMEMVAGSSIPTSHKTLYLPK